MHAPGEIPNGSIGGSSLDGYGHKNEGMACRYRCSAHSTNMVHHRKTNHLHWLILLTYLLPLFSLDSFTTPNEDGIRCHHHRRRSRPPLSCPPSVRLLLLLLVMLVLRGCTAKANEHPLPQLRPHSPSKSSTIRVTEREQQRRRCRSTRCRLGWSVVGRSVAIPHPRSFCFNFYIISTPMFSQRVPRSNLSIHLSIYPTIHPPTHYTHSPP